MYHRIFYHIVTISPSFFSDAFCFFQFYDMMELLHDVIRTGTALLCWSNGLRAKVQSGEVIQKNDNGVAYMM